MKYATIVVARTPACYIPWEELETKQSGYEVPLIHQMTPAAAVGFPIQANILHIFFRNERNQVINLTHWRKNL